MKDGWFTREVTHEMAREAAGRLIDVAFRKEGARPRFCIPTQASDDDVVLFDYIRQQERLATNPTDEEGVGE